MTEFDEVSVVGGVRVSARKRGSCGLVVSVEAVANGTWQEVVKLDAFGRAHWHLYFRHHGEEVAPLDGGGTLRGGDSVLAQLPRLLARAGYDEIATTLLVSSELERVRAAITDVVGAVLDARS